ncbi:hypothetical protein E4U57_003378 [Claviceps arundinis]|uniref:Rhodopsin domain-containing protein n=1 Tax=Claviceps arundinis TaxID=1623583 RepID=A0ABQ7P8X4_9HYPO|nr:hypothetical protein E4U57_003378 [Claviceps arundinis]
MVGLWTGAITQSFMTTNLGTISNMTDEMALTLTTEEKESIIKGSKLLLVGWCLYITTIWILKACMLFLYGRLTLDLKQRGLVNIAAILCGITYVAAILATLTHCTPLHKKWQVYPYPGDACAAYVPNFYVLTVLNVSTDLFIAHIPLPLLWKSRMSWQRKAICTLWLCTGVCMIVAALLRCILGLQRVHYINYTAIWAFIGILATNFPILGPSFTRAARRLGVLASGMSSNSGGGGAHRYGSGPRAPESGGHRLSIMERKAKHERIRSGTMEWTTFDGGSNEPIVSDEQEISFASSAKTGHDASSPTMCEEEGRRA